MIGRVGGTGGISGPDDDFIPLGDLPEKTLVRARAIRIKDSICVVLFLFCAVWFSGCAAYLAYLGLGMTAFMIAASALGMAAALIGFFSK